MFGENHASCRANDETDIVSSCSQRFIYQDTHVCRICIFVHEKEKEQQGQIDTEKDQCIYYLVRNHETNTEKS